MTISAKHAFTSAKGDPADTTLVRPSNWNAEHTITLAANSLLGRSTAGAGAVEEVPCGSFGRSLLACADIAALETLLASSLPSTGDIKPTIKTTADTGWVMCDDGTIGNAASGATTRANADTEDLYTLLWNNVSNTYAAVSTGRGASGAADFAANKTIALTKMLGRALSAAGAGSGLTSRVLGLTTGAETVTLVDANIPELAVTITDPGHTHDYSKPATGSTSDVQGGSCVGVSISTQATASNSTGITATANTASANTAVAIMQPAAFVNFMVKL